MVQGCESVGQLRCCSTIVRYNAMPKVPNVAFVLIRPIQQLLYLSLELQQLRGGLRYLHVGKHLRHVTIACWNYKVVRQASSSLQDQPHTFALMLATSPTLYARTASSDVGRRVMHCLGASS